MRLKFTLLLILLTSSAAQAGNDLPIIVAGGTSTLLGNDLPIIVAVQ